jgi:hypothetical protein
MDTMSQAGARNCRRAKGNLILRARRQSRSLQEMENSGNEAKKYLKTKEVAFLNAAN